MAATSTTTTTAVLTISVIRTIENLISTTTKPGIQILVEYRENQGSTNPVKSKKIDYRAQLNTEEKKQTL